MKSLKEVMGEVLENGEVRETRTGSVKSCWKKDLTFDLGLGFPAVTSKKLSFNAVVGELLWFLSGSSHIEDLQYYTYGSFEDKWTIWTNDAIRWNKSLGRDNFSYVGDLYPLQWRNYNRSGVDQIKNLLDGLVSKPFERDHVVMAWNPEAISANKMALKPCHVGFQCYVTGDGKLNLHWVQRSADLFLGVPFNIASYALLTSILAKLCELEVGTLSTTLLDVHIYSNHEDQVLQYMGNEDHDLPKLEMPHFKDLDDLIGKTSKDFELLDYKHSGEIRAPLSVGS